MKKIILLIFILLANLSFSQNQFSGKIKSTAFQNRESLDSIAKSQNHKVGDEIRIYLLFNADGKGNITNLEAKSIHLAFEEEAVRLFNDLELAKLIAKRNSAKPESKRYAVPIIYTMESEKERKKRLRKEKRKLNKK